MFTHCLMTRNRVVHVGLACGQLALVVHSSQGKACAGVASNAAAKPNTATVEAASARSAVMV